MCHCLIIELDEVDIDKCHAVQCNYRHWYDYLTYVWASEKPADLSNVHTVTFPASSLHNIAPGSYCLLYFSSYKHSVIAYSDQLTVSLT